MPKGFLLAGILTILLKERFHEPVLTLSKFLPYILHLKYCNFSVLIALASRIETLLNL